MADLELHGAITSFLGTQTFKELKDQCEIGEWFKNVDQAVKEHWGVSLVSKKSFNVN
jgi:hypothetical protein